MLKKLLQKLFPRLDWQPIETAPKDGTLILIYEKVTPRGADVDFRVWITYWHSDGEWRSATCANSVETFEPNYWMPLPKPPIPKEGKCN